MLRRMCRRTRVLVQKFVESANLRERDRMPWECARCAVRPVAFLATKLQIGQVMAQSGGALASQNKGLQAAWFSVIQA